MIQGDEASKISTAEHGRRVRAWHSSRTCHEAAESLGLEYMTFTQWRRNMGLPTCRQRFAGEGLPVATAERIVKRAESMAADLARVQESADVMRSQLEKSRAKKGSSKNGRT